MLAKLKNIIHRDSKTQVVGVEIGAETTYSLLLLTNQDSIFGIESSQEQLSFEELMAVLSKKHTVVLSFYGKGILSKKGAKTPDYKSKIVLNVSPAHFYFYEFHLEKEVYISVARKETVDAQFALFAAEKFFVLDYSIGPFVSAPLSALIEEDSFGSYQSKLLFSEGTLIDYSKLEQPEIVPIGDMELSNQLLPLFGTALNYVYPSQHLVYESDFLLENRKEKNFKRYFELIGAVALGGFFISLLISFLVLGHYKDEIAQNTVSLQLLQDTYTKIKLLENERDDKRAILQESGFFNVNFLSFYVQELTNDLPSTIRLNGFELFPTEKKIKPDEKINLRSKTIKITGESKSNTNFNNWYRELKKTSWISKIDIESYRSNRDGKYDFKIEIEIK